MRASTPISISSPYRFLLYHKLVVVTNVKSWQSMQNLHKVLRKLNTKIFVSPNLGAKMYDDNDSKAT